MTKEIFIVRHGETEFNKRHIVQGSGVDSSLNDTGRAQAQALFDFYKDVDFDLVITSALVRTKETAKGFLDKNIKHIADADINEISWGIFEGKGNDDVKVSMKEAYKALNQKWEQEDYDARIEGGESAAEMAHRLGRFLEKLKAREEEKILVVMHGRAIRCFICIIEGRPIKHMNDYEHANTGVYKVMQDGDHLKVVLSNNVDHLNALNTV